MTAIAEAQTSTRADPAFIIDLPSWIASRRTRWPVRAQSSIIRGGAARHARSAGSERDVELEFGPLARYPWLADEQRRVRAALGHQLLRAAVLVVPAVQVAGQVDRNRVHLEITVRQLARHLPCVEVIALEIEFDEAKRSQIGDPEALLVD